MFAKVGWLLLLVGWFVAGPGTLSIVQMIEADDPTNLAVINRYLYPASAFLYASLVSIPLVLASLISFANQEALRFSTLNFAVPALGCFVCVLVVIWVESP